MRIARFLHPPPGILSAFALLGLGACRQGEEPVAAGARLEPIVEAPSPDAPPRPGFHDFGRVPDGEVVQHVFRYRNVGTRPIEIRRVVPSCGCAVPALRSVAPDGTVVTGPPITADPPLLAIPPGGVLELDLRIDTREVAQKNVDRLYTTRIETDAEGSFYFSLEAHIFVERAFEIAAPPFVDLGRVPMSVGKTGAVSIAQGLGFDLEVKEVVEASPGLATWIVFEEILGRKVWEVTARLDPPLERGVYTGSLRVTTANPAGEPGPVLTFPVRGEIVADMEVVPARFVFATPRDERTEMAALLRSLVPGQRFLVTGCRVEPEHAALLAATFEPLQPDGEGKSGEWTLELATTPPLPADGMLRGNLVVATDDPAYPEVEVPYVVHLR